MQRIGFVLSALVGLSACQLGPNVSIDLSEVRRQAALDGVPLDRFRVRVFAEDLPPVETEVDPDTDTFSISVPSGPGRTFEVDAVRFLEDPIFTEIPAYQGSVTVDLEPGEVELTIPVRAAGAARVVARRPQGAMVPGGTTLTLSPSIGGDPLTLDASQWEVGVTLDPGFYAIIGDIVEGQVSSEVTGGFIDVPHGGIAVVEAWIVNDADRCFPEVPSDVQQVAPTCLPVDVDVMGLVGTGLMVQLNGSDTLTLDADGLTTFGLGVVEGAPVSVAVVGDPTPMQPCTVESGPTVSAPSNGPFLVTCGPPVFALGGSAVSFDGTSVDVTLDVMLPDMSSERTSVAAMPGAPFTFPTPYPDGTSYTATIMAPPAGASVVQSCSVLRGSGTIAFANVADMVVTCVREVQPIIASTSGGADCDWDRYILNDATDPFQLSGMDCVATGMNQYDDCVHCGAMRFVELPGVASCADLQSVADSASIFAWECDDSVSPLRVFTRRFDADGLLGDALEYSTPGWLPLSVVATTTSGDSLGSPSSVWWGNPVVLDNAAVTLDQAYTVYVSDAPIYPGPSFDLGAEGAALVFAPAAFVEVTRGATSQNFLYFEGAVDSLGDGGGDVVALNSCVGSLIRRVESSSDMGTGFLFTDSRANRVEDVLISEMTQGLWFTGSSTGNLVRNAFFSLNDADQVQLDAMASDNTFENVTIAPDAFVASIGSPTSGLVVASSRNRFRNLDVHGMGNHGIVVGNPGSPAADNVFTNLRLSNNGEASFSSAISLDNAPGTVITSLFAINNYSGIVGTTMSGSFIANVTLVGHAAEHVAVDTSDSLTVENVLAVTNGSGVGVGFSGVTSSRVADLFSFDNATAISLDMGADVMFTGELVAGGTVTDCSVSTATGLEDGTCNNTGASDTTRVSAPVAQATEFVGTVSDDPTNACSGSCVGISADSVADWVAFSSDFRTWGLGPSSVADAGTCAASSSVCDIQDFTLLAGSVAYDTTANLTEIRHVWQTGVAMATDCDSIPGAVFDAGDCVSFVVGDALEVIGDGIGDDDSLCESNETCVSNLHVGAYQGDPSTVMSNPTAVTLPNVTNVTFVTNSL